jgi:O-acetyl-ADP-ribose deacetylase (regulator of RNase III)
MIERLQGNLLKTDAEALVNTVNCVGVMGKGIALQFKQAFPENYREYEKACAAGKVALGHMLVFATGAMVNPKFIINFPTKQHWKGKSKIEDVRKGLVALIEEVRKRAIRSIAIPPLGCGNGGLDWSEVRPMIEAAFAELPHVQVLLFEPSGAPKAATMPVRTTVPTMTRARALFVKLIEQYCEPGYRLTLLEMQKLAYLLQMAGEPLRLNFVKHNFGPYAENLNHVLQRIEGHFIRGYGDRKAQAEIHLMPHAAEKASEVLAEDEEARKRLNRVSQAIEGFETPYSMELLATVLWVSNEKPLLAGEPDSIISQVQAWSARKRKLFRAEHIRAAWERLHQEGWLPRGE